MYSRLLVIVVGIALLTSTAAGRQEERDIQIRWRFAGSFLQNLARVGPPPASLAIIVGRGNIIHVEAIGNLGRATVRVSGGGGAPLTPPPDFPAPVLEVNPCEGLPTIPFGGENSFVATLQGDLSLLWGARDAEEQSFLCTDPASGVTHGVVYIVFKAGTGRFAGATGRGIITFSAEAVVPGSSFSVDVGTIVGTVRGIGNE